MANRHRDLFSKESNLIQQSQRALANGRDKNPIEKLRLLCFSKGCTGILQLSRVLRKLEDGGNKAINFDEFTNALQKTGLQCNPSEVKEMFTSLDEEGTGILNVSTVLDKLRPNVHQNRLDVIGRAFDKMDTNHKGTISVSDLKQVYSVKVHPKYKSGEMTEAEIWKEFLGNFQNPSDKTGTISREEFLNYYASMSASIDNDAYFDLLMRQAYSL